MKEMLDVLGPIAILVCGTAMWCCGYHNGWVVFMIILGIIECL